jgi:hypothetical protein
MHCDFPVTRGQSPCTLRNICNFIWSVDPVGDRVTAQRLLMFSLVAIKWRSQKLDQPYARNVHETDLVTFPCQRGCVSTPLKF